MDDFLKNVLWSQFGAAIETLEQAIVACPQTLWEDRSSQPEFWGLCYHTLFWLDLYLSDSLEGFAPPTPFALEELDPAGILPERVYRQDELLAYLKYGREKCRARIAGLTEESARTLFKGNLQNMTTLELLLYNLRHVQHHAAQLNLLLRQRTNSAPGWVGKAKTSLI